MNPTNRIQGEMIAPQSGSDKKTLPNLQIPYQGMHQALCIGMIDLGTHAESFKGEAPKDRRKIQLIFEYPTLKQLVYEDDTVPRSYLIYRDISFSMYQSELLKITSALSNGLYPEKDLENINLFKFLGARLYTGIKHAQSKKDPNVTYANIESYSRVGMDPAPPNFISDGKLYSFYIDPNGANFMTENFAELPVFIRKKIMESKEAIAYKERGGQFAEQKTANNDTNYSSGDNTPSQAHIQPPAGYIFEDLSGGNGTYADYVNAGWKPQDLINRGFLKQAPVQQAPMQQQQQIAPPPSQQQFQQPQQAQMNFSNQQVQQAPPAQQMQVANGAQQYQQPIQQQQQFQQAPPVQQQYQAPNQQQYQAPAQNANQYQQPVQQAPNQQYQDPNMQYQQNAMQQQPVQQQQVQQQQAQQVQQQPAQTTQQGLNPFEGDDDDLPF